jgi:membrane associated rhomboid family serine protease
MAYAPGGFGLGYMLTPWVKRLLIANTVVFLLSQIGGAAGEDLVFSWFAFQPDQIILRPWGPITYMFLHGDLWHLLFNMLMLFFFGPPLESQWGGREFLRFYFVCGVGGVALSFLFQPEWIVGSSAAMFGLMLAFAMNWPTVPIYVWGIFPVQARYLVGFMFVVTLLSASPGAEGGGVAHFAHLGGFLSGFLYLKADWRPRRKSVKEGPRTSSPRRRRLAIVPRADSDERPAAQGRPVREDAALYDRVDAVLDKISAEGMSSLTPEELRLLDEVSRRHRSN